MQDKLKQIYESLVLGRPWLTLALLSILGSSTRKQEAVFY